MARRIDHEERERAVVDAAWRVITTEGIAALSVRRVAAEARLAPSSLRYTFPTQASVRERALEAATERMGRRIDAIDADLPPREWARAALLELLPLDDDRRAEMSATLALGTAAMADASLQPLRRSFDGAVRDVCARASAALDRTDDRDVAALHALVDGLALHLAVEPDGDAAWAVAALDRWLEE